MSQFNFGTIVASTKSGSGLAADLNAWRDALHTQHKGASRPSYAVAGLGWLNDTDAPWEDYVFDGTEDALRGFIDPATHRYSAAGNFARTVPSGGVTARLADWGTLFQMTGVAAQTVAIDPKDSLIAGWWIRVIAAGISVTINPFGTELIDGLATIVLSSGSSITIFYDGLNFYSDANGGGASAFPVGGICYVPAINPPNGFIRLNGALLSRLTYSGLWGFAQTSSNIVASDGAWTEGKFSPGDGSTTFRIPDGRGTFLRAWDDARGVDPGRALGVVQAHAMQSHAHTASSGYVSADHAHYFSAVTDAQGSHAHGMYAWTFAADQDKVDPGGHLTKTSDANVVSNDATAAAGVHAHNVGGWTGGINTNHLHAITVDAAGSGTENRPRNTAYLACIKY